MDSGLFDTTGVFCGVGTRLFDEEGVSPCLVGVIPLYVVIVVDGSSSRDEGVGFGPSTPGNGEACVAIVSIGFSCGIEGLLIGVNMSSFG